MGVSAQVWAQRVTPEGNSKGWEELDIAKGSHWTDELQDPKAGGAWRVQRGTRWGLESGCWEGHVRGASRAMSRGKGKSPKLSVEELLMISVFQEDGFPRNVKEEPEGTRLGATPHGQNELFSFLWKMGHRRGGTG